MRKFIQGALGLVVCAGLGLPMGFSLPTLAQSTSTGSPTGVTPNPASNLQINSPQITNYARAVLEIETLRLRFYQQASQMLRGTVPPNTCLGNRRDNIPPGLESLCNDYLNASRAIIDKNQLSSEQFNAITLRARSDASLMARIQQELIRIQQSRPNLSRPGNSSPNTSPSQIPSQSQNQPLRQP
jgi:hypothetical protein